MAWVGSRPRNWAAISALVTTLGACSNLLGLSDYTIDPSLDAKPRPSDGAAGGGQAGDGAGGQGEPGAGGRDGAGAPATGGAPDVGGASTGQAGADGTGCSAQDCNDDIDCTVDGCDETGECVHTPDDTLCDADAGECVACQAGIGCIASPSTVVQLLNDPHFDLNEGDWVEDIRETDLQNFILNADPTAHSAGRSAWWLAQASGAPEQAYLDLLQSVTVPAGTKTLRLTGYYKLANGQLQPSQDYTVAGMFLGTRELLAFHTWRGNAAAQPAWTAFEYEAMPSKLASLLQLLQDDPEANITFDIYGETWESEFRFDTLALEATTCE